MQTMNFINTFYEKYSIDTAGQVVISLAFILLIGFALTRLTKLVKLPNVTAYILTGVIIGPFALNLIPDTIISGMSFVTDLALGFIAFGVGKYFDFNKLKKQGMGVIVITIMESFMAAIVVTLVMFLVFKLPLAFALLLGAISSATSPASTIMTIRQYRCKGEFVDTVLEVVALDDVTSLLAFSIASAVAVVLLGENTTGDFKVFDSIILPLLLNLGMIVVGGLFGFLLSKLITPKRTPDNRLIITVGMIMALVGISSLSKVFGPNISLSPLLSCMVLGMVYMNLTKDKILFHQLSDFSAPISLIFFVNSGLGFNIAALASAGVIGVVYFFVRIAGKYAGASLGGLVTKADKKVTKFLGMALIPQAGVSIGLAVLGARVLGGPTSKYGSLLSTIIISSGILYELVGPAMAKLSLQITGSMNGGVAPRMATAAVPNPVSADLPLVMPAEVKTEKKPDEASSARLKILQARQHQIDELNHEIHLHSALRKEKMAEPISTWRLGPIRKNRFPDDDEID